jgi:hypothetical protein
MREGMVETQIRARGVKDPRVLSTLLKVERHRFVPEKYLDSAYSDQPLPIGEGQTISQPYIVALMTELLDLKGGEKMKNRIVSSAAGIAQFIKGILNDRALLILTFATIAVNFPIYYYRISAPVDSDFSSHILFAQYLLGGQIEQIPVRILSHPVGPADHLYDP